MTTVLIVVGIVAFLVIDGLVFYFVFASRRHAGQYGAIPVPGQTAVTLPAGKLKLSYQESYKAGGTDDSIDFGVPAALEVMVESSSGETLAIKGPGFKGMGSSLNTGAGWSRALIGTAQVTQPGLYTVTADGELQDAIEPQVLIGK
jgi:hypothetical protein